MQCFTQHWGSVSQKLAKLGHPKGYFKTDEVESIGDADRDRIFGDSPMKPFAHAFFAWGVDMKADRSKALGFEWNFPSVDDELEAILDNEATQ
jgi:hypothetical protein